MGRRDVEGVRANPRDGGERVGAVSARAGGLARELGGDLPCVRCQYNLKGLSIRGACPECGTPIRATLLAAVDPRASELRPVPHPRLVAGGLMLWSGGALLAALFVWVVRLADVVFVLRAVREGAAWGAVGCVAGSAVGMLALIAPHGGIPRWSRLCACVALACYAAVVYGAWWMLIGHDPTHAVPYFAEGHLSRDRLGVHLVAMAGVAGIALGLRPNGRLLTIRSLLLRTGAADRQTLAGIAGAAGLAVIGDGVLLAASMDASAFTDALRIGGTVLVVCGSVLLTLGLIGVVVDSWRIRGVILQPPFTLDQLFAGNEGDTRGRGDSAAPEVRAERAE